MTKYKTYLKNKAINFGAGFNFNPDLEEKIPTNKERGIAEYRYTFKGNCCFTKIGFNSRVDEILENHGLLWEYVTNEYGSKDYKAFKGMYVSEIADQVFGEYCQEVVNAEADASEQLFTHGY
jgi:hypothetical protein